MTRYISTPWRESYVKNALKMKKCVFCEAFACPNDRDAYILLRGNHNFVILNKFPYTPGHLMIAPVRHLKDFERAQKAEAVEIVELLKVSLKILKKNYHPHGFNAGMNLGHSAGAGVADHFHLHVIPRWTGDSNFMPLVAKTRVLLEDLTTTYDRLYPLFEKEKKLRQKGRR